MRYKVFSEGFGVIRDELLLGVNDEFAEIAEMVLPWWTSQSDGTHSQPSRGCGLRARDRSQLFGRPRGGGPAIRSDHPFSARHGCRCGGALSRIHARRGSELGTQCEGSGEQRHPTSWSSRRGAPENAEQNSIYAATFLYSPSCREEVFSVTHTPITLFAALGPQVSAAPLLGPLPTE